VFIQTNGSFVSASYQHHDQQNNINQRQQQQ